VGWWFVVGLVGFWRPAFAGGLAVGSVGLARTTEIYAGAVVVLALLAVASVLARRGDLVAARPPAAEAEPVTNRAAA
jgi:hypothetical protein